MIGCLVSEGVVCQGERVIGAICEGGEYISAPR